MRESAVAMRGTSELVRPEALTATLTGINQPFGELAGVAEPLWAAVNSLKELASVFRITLH